MIKSEADDVKTPLPPGNTWQWQHEIGGCCCHDLSCVASVKYEMARTLGIEGGLLLMSNDVQILSETKWLKSISFPGVMRVAVSLYYDGSSVSLQLSNARHLRPYFQPVLMSQDIRSTSANLLGNLSGALLVIRTCRHFAGSINHKQHGSGGQSHRILGPWG
jgi:hypothetical protein